MNPSTLIVPPGGRADSGGTAPFRSALRDSLYLVEFSYHAETVAARGQGQGGPQRMKKKIHVVEEFFSFGCGRCELGGTPECKMKTWDKELRALQKIALECGLEETLKWSFPCYTSEGKNIVLIGAFNDYCSLSFFGGSLLSDPQGILVKPGENSREGRLAKFTSLQQIRAHKTALIACIEEAIENSKKGLKRERGADEKVQLPTELKQAFTADPQLREAFFNLTPGRQRGYVLHFSQAKQSSTRSARIEKCKSKILSGLGFHDR